MASNNPIPPKLAQRILSRVLRDDLAEEVLGDLEESFYSTVEKKSTFKAKLNYWYQLLNYLRPFALKKTTPKHFNQLAMYRHYIKLAWRNMTKQKVFSSIKIGGFSIGIMACILIGLFIKDEKSFDKHYVDGDSIFRLANVDNSTQLSRWTNLSSPYQEVLNENFPEIEKVARVSKRIGNEHYFRRIENERNTYELGFTYADPELLEILEIPMVYGDQKDALTELNSVVISKSKADLYYPNENPVGKQVILDDGKKTLTIGGVMEDFPSTSHLQHDFIVSLSGVELWEGERANWFTNNHSYYLKVQPNTDKYKLEKKLLYIKDRYIVPQLLANGSPEAEDVKTYRSYYLQPVENIYLSPDGVNDGLLKHGVVEVIWVFGIIAIIILVLAVINFVNLSTAKSANRAKEVGLRKVIGSNKSNLMGQYLSESLIYSFASILLGAFFAWLALPMFNSLSGKELVFPWFEWWFLPAVLFSVFVIGLCAGFYPAVYLSSFKPIDVLKGKLSQGSKNSRFRSALVVFQFTTSIILIICAIISDRQMQFFLTKELGFDKEQVITIKNTDSMGKNQQAFKNELLKRSDIQDVTVSSFLPIASSGKSDNMFWKEGRKNIDRAVSAQFGHVDSDYINTLDIKVSEGRNFSKKLETEQSAIIINRELVDCLGLDNPVGSKVITFMGTKEVIGVLDDFHFGSLARSIRPLCLFYGNSGSMVIVKTKSKDMQQTLGEITSTWDAFMPHQSIKYDFLDESYAQTFTNDLLQRIKSIFLLFAGLAIFIACLGLFALCSFMVEQRSKEMSIRKVLGANFSSILHLLSIYFIKLVLIAMVIAIPIAWVLMTEFLKNFTYCIEIGWSVFLISGVTTILVALITIGGETVNEALSNPADRLRSE